ncbi:MAG TPA: TetR/AcrR family transcriptional regulator [Kofleriaceae bacterium]|nr:TetR/AcrR family transcriptional regulator [Kofleriaceae bacterium]
MEAIIVAATRVLEREGLERLTTTRIAEVAGVSVGSLYQYFPNREAIVGAIIDRQLDTMLRAFRELVTTFAGLALEQCVTSVLFGLLEVARLHEKLHAPLFEEMSAARRSEQHQRALDAYVDIVAATLATRRDVTLACPRAAANLIVHAGDGVIRSLVLTTDVATANVLVREAVRMIMRYLTPAPS